MCKEESIHAFFTKDINNTKYIAKDAIKTVDSVYCSVDAPDSFCHALSLQETDYIENGVLLLYLGRRRAIITFQPHLNLKLFTQSRRMRHSPLCIFFPNVAIAWKMFR